MYQLCFQRLATLPIQIHSNATNWIRNLRYCWLSFCCTRNMTAFKSHFWCPSPLGAWWRQSSCFAGCSGMGSLFWWRVDGDPVSASYPLPLGKQRELTVLSFLLCSFSSSSYHITQHEATTSRVHPPFQANFSGRSFTDEARDYCHIDSKTIQVQWELTALGFLKMVIIMPGSALGRQR